jgi:alkanesulfonate monooxygenase SsuD/methylene tetrahydromethanopterin reductase-like flavin-dependent oxidoreductase (luciferase family)
MLKTIVQMYPVIQAKDEAERIALRPIGRNRERYQDAIRGWVDVAQAADRLGVWGMATVEHHFWSEGYEVGPSPGPMAAFMASVTQNLNVGSLGYVLSTQNPIRVAEETAVIDHIAGGRSFVGFARGYQSRWTNVLGQQYGTVATKSPNAAVYNASTTKTGFSTATSLDKDLSDDARNRAVFEEHAEIILKAWTQDSMSHDGTTWKIPYPYESGVEGWPLSTAGVTQRLGALDEVDENGAVRNVSVCPAPYQRPHPPVFVSGSGSPETISFAAKKGFRPVYFTNIDSATKLSNLYQSEAEVSGRHLAPGQDQCLVRWLQIGQTDAAAYKMIEDYDFDIFKNFYGAMGRRKMIEGDQWASMRETGLFVMGSVDTVRQQLLDQWTAVPFDHIGLVYHYAQMPKDAVIESLDLFMTRVKPDLDEVIFRAQQRR